ncbi:YdcF family protein [Corynebacterium stercoris]|uniref:YdcF family protein n=1 Tax=Corynebacterium stercoris TaxID=2943490 RepID=UPI0034632564
MSNQPIVVLGARVVEGRPSRMLASRLSTALSHHQLHPAPIVVTGRGEADVMAAWLRERGVAAGEIIVEPHATSTNENLERSRALLPDAARLTVVTNRYHAARTRIWAWHLGIPIDVVAAPMPPGRPLKNLKHYARELVAVPHSVARVAWRRLLHRLSPARFQ